MCADTISGNNAVRVALPDLAEHGVSPGRGLGLGCCSRHAGQTAGQCGELLPMPVIESFNLDQ